MDPQPRSVPFRAFDLALAIAVVMLAGAVLLGALRMRGASAAAHRAVLAIGWRDEYLVGLVGGLVLIAIGLLAATALALLLRRRRRRT